MSWKREKRPPDPLAALRRLKHVPEDAPGAATVKAHEERAAALFGGSRHRGSGASPFLKSDASSELYQIECKQTEKASIRLELDWLRKITCEAMGRGKLPVLHVCFLKATLEVDRDWVLLPAREVARLLGGAS